MQLLRQTGFLFPLVVILGILSGGMVVLQSLELSRVISAVFLDEKNPGSGEGNPLFILNHCFHSGTLHNIKRYVIHLDGCQNQDDAANSGDAKDLPVGSSLYSHTAKWRIGDGCHARHRGSGCLLQPVPTAGSFGCWSYLWSSLPLFFPLDWVSGLIFLLTAPLIPFFMALVGKASENETKKQWKALPVWSGFSGYPAGINDAKNIRQKQSSNQAGGRG